MNISVFGVGYVGCVSAACLARDGHQVVGVDINRAKVDQLTAGQTPVMEPKLGELVKLGVGSGQLRATVDGRSAVHQTEVSLICVGTPSKGNGSLHLGFVDSVCRQIGAALAEKPAYHVVVVRSTVLPGTIRSRLIPLLETVSGRRAGADFGVCMNPEFLRESTAIDDYYRPSQIVIGALDDRSARAVERLYGAVEAPVVRTTIEAAEMVKYVNNAFHALKVTFANEMGNLCKAHRVDGREVMEIFCRDRQLNISPTYFKPGFAFGGSCLPKDTRALVYRGRQCDVSTPVLGAILKSNEQQIRRGIEMVESTGRKRVGILGLSFKAGTDDVRESPAIPLVETLVGRGYDVVLYDEHFELSKLTGANKAFLDREIPHIASLLAPCVSDVLAHADVVVITHNSSAFANVPAQLRADQTLIDLVGALVIPEDMKANYSGICWPSISDEENTADGLELPPTPVTEAVVAAEV
jgi:GDP-mannose 6-dehydrogenase